MGLFGKLVATSVNVVLAYKPKPKSKAAKKRKRKEKKLENPDRV